MRRADVYGKLLELNVPCTDPKALFHSIILLNAEYGKKGFFKKLRKELNSKELTKFDGALERAKEQNFYLGLVRLEWIKEIKC